MVADRWQAFEQAGGNVDAFLSTHFSAEPRHARRLEMVTRYEQNGELPPIPASEG